MKSFLEWMEGIRTSAAGHSTTGRLSDWIEKNKEYIRVQNGYGDCSDCVRVFLDPQAEDESRKASGLGQTTTDSGLDLWGLWHLEDYVVTSRTDRNSVILMPVADEGFEANHNEGKIGTKIGAGHFSRILKHPPSRNWAGESPTEPRGENLEMKKELKAKRKKM
jgi:hypothetical protein